MAVKGSLNGAKGDGVRSNSQGVMMSPKAKGKNTYPVSKSSKPNPSVSAKYPKKTGDTANVKMDKLNKGKFPPKMPQTIAGVSSTADRSNSPVAGKGPAGKNSPRNPNYGYYKDTEGPLMGMMKNKK